MLLLLLYDFERDPNNNIPERRKSEETTCVGYHTLFVGKIVGGVSDTTVLSSTPPFVLVLLLSAG